MAKNEAFIDTTLDTKGVEVGAERVQRIANNMARNVAKTAQNMGKSMTEAFTGEPIPTEEYAQLEKELSKLGEQYDKIASKEYRFIQIGGKEKSQTYKGMEYDLDEIERKQDAVIAQMRKMEAEGTAYKPLGMTEEYEQESEVVEKTADSTERLAKAQNKANNSAQKGHKIFAGLTNRLNQQNKGLKSGFRNLLKYTLGIRSMFVLFNRLRGALVEGFKNLAQFNDGVNPTNKALSNLMSSLSNAKNAFATAFAPILTVVEPILTRLIDALSKAMTAIGMFFAALTGSRTFTKAVKVQQDYAKSLDKTGASAKKAQTYLSGLDEVAKYTSKDESGSASGGGISTNEMFEDVEVPRGVSDLADKVKAIIEPLKESIANWFSNVNFEPLLASFQNLRSALEPIVSNIGTALLWLLENVLEPIGSFVIEDALPSFFNLLASAVNFCTTAFDVLRPTLEDIWNNILAPLAQFIGDIFVEVIDDITFAIGEFTNVFRSKSQEINNILQFVSRAIQLVGTVVQTVVQFILGMIRPLASTVSNVVGNIISILNGLITFISGVFTANWRQALNGLVSIGKGVVNILIDVIEGAINTIVGGLNHINVKVPNWIPGVGGKQLGFNVPKAHFPRLATGTVVPRQASEFMAVLGDNNRETEVVSPLSTMKQAMLEAMSESGGGRGGSYRFTAQINRRTLFDEMIDEARLRQLQSGTNPFDLARA